MGRVSFSEAINYGFSLIMYFFGVGLVGLSLIFVGGLVALEGALGSGTGDELIMWFIIGSFISIFGYLVIIAGIYGTFYKVIADGVGRGMSGNTPTSNLKVINATPSGIPRSPY